MPKKADADTIQGVEKKTQFHLGRFLFFGLALAIGIELYGGLTDPRRRTETTEALSYQTLESGFGSILPQYDYSKLTIDDTLGPDPVLIGNTFLGHVRDDADALYKDGKVTGYVLHGLVYNTAGRKVGKLVSGKIGYEIMSFSGNKLGTFIEGRIASVDGTTFGSAGGKAAVLVDSSYNLSGVILGYDFSRKNL